MSTASVDEVFNILKRDAVSIYSEEGLYEKLKSGRKLRIKLGADPSRPDLHLGHSVVLNKLRLLQDLGHEIVFVIGDFTGMIGDPSGRSKTRQPLTFEDTRQNAKSYMEQVVKILDKDKTVITYNSEWLSQMNFSDVLQLAGKYTLARIMERDDFAKRYSQNFPIGLHEIFYPLMQGYDSVALSADIEVGGTDQTFNLLVGRELQRDYGQPPQEVITFPLLPGLDGIEKMSKSLDNYIGIDEAPEIMFEKCMKVPDNLLCDYFRLTTSLAEKDYIDTLNQDIRKAHFIYAEAIVSRYHSFEEACEAKKRYLSVAGGSIPDNIDTYELSVNEISLIELLKQIGYADSNSDARRLVQGGGIKINNNVITDFNLTVTSAEPIIISRGKSKYRKIVFK